MTWKTIDKLTDSERYGKVLHIFHPYYICEDFNPEGVIEGYCIDVSEEADKVNKTFEWFGAVWNNDQDCWDTKEVVPPTHYMILKGPKNDSKTE